MHAVSIDRRNAISGQRQSPARRSAAVCLSAGSLILLAACSAGSKSAATPPTPRQAVLAAAKQAQQLTSATETLAVHVSGASSSSTTGTILVRLKPALLVSGNLNTTAAGASTRVKMILTSAAMYFSEPSLTSQLGKPWVKIDPSALPALAGSSEASVAQLVQSLQNNNFTGQAQLATVARNTRAAGQQVVGGVPTTEYTGSFTASDGLKALPVGLSKALAPELQALGNSTIYFREWIDGQNHVRKVTDIETLNGDTVNTTINVTGINQPVSITLPPASQTFLLPGSGPASGRPSNVDLRAKIVPAPPGFALSQADNGPINAAKFNSYMGSDMAASLHFVRGYDIFYDGASTTDNIEVTLFQFATQTDAAIFQAGWDPGIPVTSKADPVIPGAKDYDSTSPDQGSYDHGVIASKGTFVFVIDDLSSSAAPAPLLGTMARQQYAAL